MRKGPLWAPTLLQIDPQTGVIHIGNYSLKLYPGPSPIYLTLLSSMFMHGSIGHLFGNMLYLWIFGDNVEDRMGSAKFLGFYLICGIAATLVQVAVSQNSSIPNLGASGAIAGVLGAYLVMFPRGEVRVLMGRNIVNMPALAVLGLWILLQFISGIGSIANTAQTGGVAYMAHIGGFVTGLALAYVFRNTGKLQDATRWRLR